MIGATAVAHADQRPEAVPDRKRSCGGRMERVLQVIDSRKRERIMVAGETLANFLPRQRRILAIAAPNGGTLPHDLC
jgi:hypothetical protein